MRPVWWPTGMPAGLLYPVGHHRMSLGQFGESLLPDLLVAGLTRLVDLGEADLALGVDEEGSAVGHASLVVEHAVCLGDLAVRPEVREQRERVALLVRPRLERERGVDRHA